jgi:hypothetical protein
VLAQGVQLSALLRSQPMRHRLERRRLVWQGCSTLCGILGESWAQQVLAERRRRSGNRLPRSAEL